jgi:hypothetical protein
MFIAAIRDASFHNYSIFIDYFLYSTKKLLILLLAIKLLSRTKMVQHVAFDSSC